MRLGARVGGAGGPLTVQQLDGQRAHAGPLAAALLGPHPPAWLPLVSGPMRAQAGARRRRQGAAAGQAGRQAGHGQRDGLRAGGCGGRLQQLLASCWPPGGSRRGCGHSTCSASSLQPAPQCWLRALTRHLRPAPLRCRTPSACRSWLKPTARPRRRSVPRRWPPRRPPRSSARRWAACRRLGVGCGGCAESLGRACTQASA